MKAIELRHQLHAHPELSGKEYQTQALLLRVLQSLNPSSLEKVGETGVLAVFDSGKPGDTVLFRADIDALPIDEPNDLPYRSTFSGKGHKCGHDGHTAILYRTAQLISANPPKKGKVLALFQPSEENGQGAQKVLADPLFAQYDYQYAYALHNIPGAPLGQVLCCEGNFNAGVSSLSFEYQGLETHAAHPWEGKNPALLIAELLNWAAAQENTDWNSAYYYLCTPGYSYLGAKNYGISPATGGVHFTTRAWQGELLDRKIEALQAKAQAAAQLAGIALKMERFEDFWPVINQAKAVEQLRSAAEKLNYSYQTMPYPFSWGEDFGLIAKNKVSVMFGLGSGEDCPVLHHPEYDFPDALIERGAALFYQLIEQHLNG